MNFVNIASSGVVDSFVFICYHYIMEDQYKYDQEPVDIHCCRVNEVIAELVRTRDRLVAAGSDAKFMTVIISMHPYCDSIQTHIEYKREFNDEEKEQIRLEEVARKAERQRLFELLKKEFES